MKGGKMKTKKSQTEIIVTVLLVLLALAAVAFMYTFVMGQIRKGAEVGANKADCINLDFEITSAIAGQTNIIVKRNDDGKINVSKLALTVAGQTWNNTVNVPSTLSTESSNGAQLVLGQDVVLDALLQNGATCTGIATKKVTNA
jgi:flagellar basal body-associated protein FliL